MGKTALVSHNKIVFQTKALDIEKRKYLVELIPDNWLAIDGRLHAPLDYIKRGYVVPGVIWAINGKSLGEENLGYGTNKFSVGYCEWTEKIDRNDISFCRFYKDLKSEEATIGNAHHIVTGEKGPCGVFLEKAGAFIGEKDLKTTKQIMNDYIQKGYVFGYFVALSGIFLSLRKRFSINPKVLPSETASPEGFGVFGNSDGTRVEVFWRRESGGKKGNVQKILNGLSKLGLEQKLF